MATQIQLVQKKKNIVRKVSQEKNEFLAFIKDYNVLQLAIGVVVGNSVKDLVNSTANNLIMPIIGLVTPGGSWQRFGLKLFGANFNIGLFLSSLLDFLIVAGIVFIIIKKILKIDIDSKPKKV